MTARRGLAFVVGVAVVFFASWWNAYLPPTSGGEAVLMARWAHDYLPYRDYFSQAPPGVPMLVQAITAVAGPRLLSTLTFGVLLRVAASAALYGLLLRIARPSHAVLATLSALFVSSTDISDTPFYYNHLGTAFIVCGTYLGAASSNGSRLGHRLAGIGAGALLTFAVAIKQTMVFGSVAAFVALILLAWPRPRIGWFGWLAALVAGAAVTVAGVWLWLVRNDLLGAWLEIMRAAPEGKGGIWRSLFRPLSLLVYVQPALSATLAGWIVIAIVALLWLWHRRGQTVSHGLRLVYAVVGAVTIGALVARDDSRSLTLFMTALGWWGSLTFAGLQLAPLGNSSQDPSDRATVALGVLSFGIGYCFAVSWPLFENMALPGLAVVTAVLLERPPAVRAARWTAAMLAVITLAIGLSCYRKFTYPHLWGEWLEPPILSARGQFAHPALAGMRLSAPSADLYTIVSRFAEQYSTPADRLYVFPNLPILYAIADRRPATFSMVHWVDISPDFLGRRDAAELMAHPPKLMIIREDSETLVEIEEFLYRGGQPSSVRHIMAAIHDLKPAYHRVAVFDQRRISAPISFFVRRDALQ